MDFALLWGGIFLAWRQQQELGAVWGLVPQSGPLLPKLHWEVTSQGGY